MQLACQALVIALLSGALVPLATALCDEASALREFPILSDLEGAFEVTRWAGSAGLSVTQKASRSGRRSLRLDLGTEEYSGVSLKYFPRDWRGFRVLRFSVYNPDLSPLTLTCRVHDEEHVRRGYGYRDRFNMQLAANPGWNDVEIPLASIAAAPRGRLLDLARVSGFGVFATRLASPRTLYLDGLRLDR